MNLRGTVAQPIYEAMVHAAAPLSIDDLRRLTGARWASINTRLESWMSMGVVQIAAQQPRRYVMINKTAERPGVAANRSSARQAMWTAMRVLKRFDIPTLLITTEVTRKTALVFLLQLQRAGFVRRIADGDRKRGQHSTFLMVRRSGPRAPTLNTPTIDGRRRQVLTDRNDGRRYDVSDSAQADGARAINHVC